MNVETVNDYLFNTFGRDVLYNLPKWRVVWSLDQIQKVWETYEDITEAGIYLGTKTGWREKPKYWYLKPCYVLEKLYTATSSVEKEDLSGSYSYEPMLTFLDQHDNMLPVKLEAVQFFLRNYLSSERKFRDIKDEEIKRDNAAVEAARNILYESPVSDALSYGEGVVVPSNYKKEEANV